MAPLTMDTADVDVTGGEGVGLPGVGMVAGIVAVSDGGVGIAPWLPDTVGIGGGDPDTKGDEVVCVPWEADADVVDDGEGVGVDPHAATATAIAATKDGTKKARATRVDMRLVYPFAPMCTTVLRTLTPMLRRHPYGENGDNP